jgi:hypothetical protein
MTTNTEPTATEQAIDDAMTFLHAASDAAFRGNAFMTRGHLRSALDAVQRALGAVPEA